MHNWLEFIRGLVRPTLAWGGFSVLSIGVLRGQVSWETYAPMVGMMVAFWFATRKPNSGSH